MAVRFPLSNTSRMHSRARPQAPARFDRRDAGRPENSLPTIALLALCGLAIGLVVLSMSGPPRNRCDLAPIVDVVSCN